MDLKPWVQATKIDLKEERPIRKYFKIFSNQKINYLIILRDRIHTVTTTLFAGNSFPKDS